jgi:hypothetical protein
MNDFTKEELTTIIDAFNFIHGAAAWRTTEGWDDELQDKIQSMIDNYCEHDHKVQYRLPTPVDELFSGKERYVFLCIECNEYFL